MAIKEGIEGFDTSSSSLPVHTHTHTHKHAHLYKRTQHTNTHVHMHTAHEHARTHARKYRNWGSALRCTYTSSALGTSPCFSRQWALHICVIYMLSGAVFCWHTWRRRNSERHRYRMQTERKSEAHRETETQRRGHTRHLASRSRQVPIPNGRDTDTQRGTHVGYIQRERHT